MKMTETRTSMVMDKKKICNSQLKANSMARSSSLNSTTTTAETLDTTKAVIKVDTDNSLHLKSCITLWLYRLSASRQTAMQPCIRQATTLEHIQRCILLHRYNVSQCMALTHLECHIQLDIDTHQSIR